MGALDTRRGRFGVVLFGIAAFTVFMLADVLGTIFFAVTIAYVAYPLKRRLVDRGVSNRVATSVVTLSVFGTTGPCSRRCW